MANDLVETLLEAIRGIAECQAEIKRDLNQIKKAQKELSARLELIRTEYVNQALTLQQIQATCRRRLIGDTGCETPVPAGIGGNSSE